MRCSNLALWGGISFIIDEREFHINANLQDIIGKKGKLYSKNKRVQYKKMVDPPFIVIPVVFLSVSVVLTVLSLLCRWKAGGNTGGEGGQFGGAHGGGGGDDDGSYDGGGGGGNDGGGGGSGGSSAC